MSAKQSAKMVLVIIGSLFSLTSIMLVTMIAWFFYSLEGEPAGMEIKGFLTSASILTITTVTISVFIWWIIFRKNWFHASE